MFNRTQLVVALGAVGITLASASVFAREDAQPRGADNRPGNVRQARGADDAAKVPVVTTQKANDNVPGDRNGNKNLPDDNNNNRGGGNGKGGADDGPGHH